MTLRVFDALSWLVFIATAAYDRRSEAARRGECEKVAQLLFWNWYGN